MKITLEGRGYNDAIVLLEVELRDAGDRQASVAVTPGGGGAPITSTFRVEELRQLGRLLTHRRRNRDEDRF